MGTRELARKNDGLLLWCLHCRHCFTAGELRVDFLGEREQCAHCAAAGLGIDIFVWEPGMECVDGRAGAAAARRERGRVVTECPTPAGSSKVSLTLARESSPSDGASGRLACSKPGRSGNAILCTAASNVRLVKDAFTKRSLFAILPRM